MRRTASIVALLALGLWGAWAQPGSTEVDGDLVLHCRVLGHVPEEPGSAEQGGYGFEYQSLHGTTEDDRACTVYRLRNTSGKPPTPFRWTHGEAVVVDKGRLPRCAGEACDWLTFAKYFAGEVDAGLSTLAYGLNADAYRDEAETFVGAARLRDDRAAADAGVRASSVGTELVGDFATEAGARVAVHLIVKSRFEPAPAGGTRLVYEVEDLARSGALGTGAVRVEWDALRAVGLEAAWPAAAPAPGVAVERTAHALTVAVEAAAFALDDALVLRVFARGDDEPLVVVPMPAYVAIDAPAPAY